MNDELLARFLVDREPRLYEQLVEAYRPLVYSVCRRYLRDPADVDDAAQETFLKLSRHLDDISGHVSGWLTSVAYTTCLNLIRSGTRERRRREMLGRMGSANVEHCLLHEAIGHRLQQALLQLDAPSRQLIASRFFKKEPMRVIAGETNVSLATVSRRVSQALTDLAAVLRDMGIESADDMTLAEHFGAMPELPDQIDAGGGLRFAADWQAAALYLPDRNPLGMQVRLLPGWKRPLRVGVFIGYQATRVAIVRGIRMEAEYQANITPLLDDPGMQLVSIVEPGTSGRGPIERTLRDYELLGGLIDVTDVASLKTLDVIIFANNFDVAPAVTAALAEAVESGVGLLKEYWCGVVKIGGRQDDAGARKLLLADSPISAFHMPHHCGEQVPAVVEEEHPLLPGLKKGDRFKVSGCSPLYRVAPGATVPIFKDRWVSPEEHGIAGLGSIRPPAFIVGRLGEGRVVVIHEVNLPGLARRLHLGDNYFSTLLTWLADPRRERS